MGSGSKGAQRFSIKDAADSKSRAEIEVLWSHLHFLEIPFDRCGEWMGGGHTYRQGDQGRRWRKSAKQAYLCEDSQEWWPRREDYTDLKVI